MTSHRLPDPNTYAHCPVCGDEEGGKVPCSYNPKRADYFLVTGPCDECKTNEWTSEQLEQIEANATDRLTNAIQTGEEIRF